jgi:hypothetical protein
MKTRFAIPGFIAAALAFASMAAARAGETAPPDATAVSAPADSGVADSTPAPSNIKTSYELDADTSYVGDARTNYGGGTMGNVSEERTRTRFVVSPQYNDGPIYRFGLSFQRYSFGFSKAAPMPNILQAENLVVGMDFTLFNSWLIRIEADPGFYNDGRYTGFRDANVPFIMGGSYIASADLQWIVGLEADINRQLPVIPAVGVRWSLGESWVIDAVLPTPRLEYDWSKSLTLYVGGDVDDGTYRADRNLGVSLGRPNLSGAVFEYDEIRFGAGLSWKASKALTFELEGGYLPYREFDFHRADTHFSNDGGAPYGQMSLNAQF